MCTCGGHVRAIPISRTVRTAQDGFARPRRLCRSSSSRALQSSSMNISFSDSCKLHGSDDLEVCGDAASARAPPHQYKITSRGLCTDRNMTLRRTSTTRKHAQEREAGPRVKGDPFDANPRHNYLSWDDYFMALAFLSAQRSKDPNKQVGACIVGIDQIILGIGYNGFPRGCADGKLPWAKLSRSGSKLETKYPYVVHAEANSILNAKNTPTLAGANMYVTMFPCNECAKLIIQAGIKEVVYFEDKNRTAKGSPTKGGIRPEEAYQASRLLLSMAGVRLRQHRLHLPLLVGGTPPLVPNT